MQRLVIPLVLSALSHASVGCVVTQIYDPSETAAVREKQEHKHWIRQVEQSAVVAEVHVIDEVRTKEYALFSLRPNKVWKSDGHQLNRAYIAFGLCNQLDLAVGQSYIVFAVRRDVPSTHQGRPMQVVAIESAPEPRPSESSEPTLAATHAQRLLNALGEATAVRAQIVP